MTDWPAGVEKRLYSSLDSTMAEAMRLAPQLAGPAWILARDQTAGRGRQGRDWVQPGGSFSASLIWRPDGSVESRAQRSFAAALALRDTLSALIGRSDGLTLKWPNDVLLNGGKVAGILLESRVEHLIIGIGVNLLTAPRDGEIAPGSARPVSLMGETGLRVEPESFLDLLAPAYAEWEATLTTHGFAPLRREWLTHAARLGEVITARVGADERQGIFETVDAAGALVLKTRNGRETIAAADVYF